MHACIITEWVADQESGGGRPDLRVHRIRSGGDRDGNLRGLTGAGGRYYHEHSERLLPVRRGGNLPLRYLLRDSESRNLASQSLGNHSDGFSGFRGHGRVKRYSALANPIMKVEILVLFSELEVSVTTHGATSFGKQQCFNLVNSIFINLLFSYLR